MNVGNFGFNILLLRRHQLIIQAYSNRCPAHGQRNQWDLLNNSTFKCNHQGNTYSTDCEIPQLDCLTTSINGDELTLTM